MPQKVKAFPKFFGKAFLFRLVKEKFQGSFSSDHPFPDQVFGETLVFPAHNFCLLAAVVI